MTVSGASTVHPRPREVHHVPSPAHTSPEPTRQLPADCVELFARALHADGAKADGDGKLPLPKWVHLSPAGDDGHELAKKGERVVRGRDGREFAIGDVKRVLAGTELPMQFDWDHESVSWFGSTKAAGWIDEIVYLEKGDDERPEPGFWGHVERWTPEGKSDVEEARYRGLSPVVRYEYRQPAASDEPAPPPLLVGFVNVALTNRPNLKMTLLNAQEPNAASAAGDDKMNPSLLAIAKSLGLPDGATPEQLAHAINAKLSAFAELEGRVERAQAHAHDLERQLADQKAASFKAEVDAFFESVKDRFEPNALAYHRADVDTRERFERFKAHASTLPKHALLREIEVPGDKPHTSAVLTEEERKIAHAMGLTDEEVLAAKQKRGE